MNIIDTEHVGQEQPIEQTALEQPGETGPVIETRVICRSIARMPPEPLLDVADTIHVEGVKTDLLHVGRLEESLDHHDSIPTSVFVLAHANVGLSSNDMVKRLGQYVDGQMTKAAARKAAIVDAELDELKQIVRSLLNGLLPEGALSDVLVTRGQDSDGDLIYRITIALEPGKERIDGKKMVGFVRHLRSRMDEGAFPIISYVSKADADKLKRASA